MKKFLPLLLLLAACAKQNETKQPASSCPAGVPGYATCTQQKDFLDIKICGGIDLHLLNGKIFVCASNPVSETSNDLYQASSDGKFTFPNGNGPGKACSYTIENGHFK